MVFFIIFSEEVESPAGLMKNKKREGELPPYSCELNSYFTSFLFLSACAEAGGFFLPSETFPLPLRLCKHQSDNINYARGKKKRNTKKREEMEGKKENI